MEYRDYKNRLSRFGFAPNGKCSDLWAFANYSKEGIYDIIIYLNEDNLPFEYRIEFSCGNVDDCDLTYNNFEELLNKLREIKKANKNF